jgi:hypothetical protein
MELVGLITQIVRDDNPARVFIDVGSFGLAIYQGSAQTEWRTSEFANPGTIAERAGNPTSKPRWQWSCNFYPGSHPSEHARGIAETFDQARGAFEIAWRFVHAKRYGG